MSIIIVEVRKVRSCNSKMLQIFLPPLLIWFGVRVLVLGGSWVQSSVSKCDARFEKLLKFGRFQERCYFLFFVQLTQAVKSFIGKREMFSSKTSQKTAMPIF